MPQRIFEQCFLGTMAALPAFEKALHTAATHHGLDEQTTYIVDLAFEEIITNIVKYAQSPTGICEIDVRLTLSGREAVLRIADNGHAFNPLEYEPPPYDPAAPPSGQWGIMLVRKMASGVTYSRVNERNILTVYITRAVPAEGGEPEPDHPEGSAAATRLPAPGENEALREAWGAMLRHEFQSPARSVVGLCDLSSASLRKSDAEKIAPGLEAIRDLGETLYVELEEMFRDRRVLALIQDDHGPRKRMRKHVRKIIAQADDLDEMLQGFKPKRTAVVRGYVEQIAVQGYLMLHLLDNLARFAEGRGARTPDGLVDLHAEPADTDAPSPEVIEAMRLRTPRVDAEVKGRRVLVADDDELNRTILERHLVRRGFEVELAADGKDAVKRMSKAPFDVVLMDTTMPRVSGFEALMQIKQDPLLRSVPVVMIWSMNQIETVVACIARGAEDFLTKPINGDLLAAKLNNILEKYAAYQELAESRRRLTDDLDQARRYVESLLPTPLEAPVRSAWQFHPHAGLGGDLLDCWMLDRHRVAAFVLDVSGHGVASAMLAATIKFALAAAVRDMGKHLTPAGLLARLHDAFPSESYAKNFFTIWFGIVELEENRIVYASAGHPPALLIPLDHKGRARPGDVVRLATRNPPCGFGPRRMFAEAEITYTGPAGLVVYSDGAFEVESETGEWFSEQHMVESLLDRRDAKPDKARGFRGIDALMHDLIAFRGSGVFDDDVTLLQVDLP